jgi:dihydrofolate reductase
VRLGGGVATVREYLRAGLVDEMHLALRPVLLGAGENLFEGLDLHALGYEVATRVEGERATHSWCTGARSAEGSGRREVEAVRGRLAELRAAKRSPKPRKAG